MLTPFINSAYKCKYSTLFILLISIGLAHSGTTNDLIFKSSLEELHTLTYTSGLNGLITGDTTQIIETGQDGSAIMALADVGYHFVDWSDASTINPRIDTNIQADITVTANIAINTYTLTYNVGNNGSILGTSPQLVDYNNSGSEVTVVVDNGYHFVDWSDGTAQNPRTDTNIQADITVTANIAINTYTLTYNAGNNGSILGTSPQLVDYNNNGSEVTVVVDNGYHFVDWSDGNTQNPRTDTNIQADITVTANIAINTYTLTYNAGNNSSILGTSPQLVDYNNSGSEVTVVTDNGYHFVDWSDANTQNPRTDTNVQADITVTANIAINTYTLTYNAGLNGSINGTTPQTIEHSNNGTAVTALAHSGYVFEKWSDDSINNPRIDTNVQEDLIISATFVPDSFGQAGSKTVATPYQEPNELATIYYPTDASSANKVPVIFFAPGWGGDNANDYDTIFRFIASHGFAVIYAKDDHSIEFTSSYMLEDFQAMVNDPAIMPLLDTTRIGVIGHSSGGGHAFNILDKLSSLQGWGVNGRFIFISEGWFAFDMMQIDMLTLPSNTNVVMQQYGSGGNSANNGTDARIVLTEYYLLESIADEKKDYQVHANADHDYPYGAGETTADYLGMQIILQPLDALMQYTFVDPNNQIAHDAALELGNDDPYADGNGIQVVLPRGIPQYSCNGYNFTVEDIDYCDIKGYPYSSQLDYLATNVNTFQPTLDGVPSTDLEFGTTVTRLTNRETQTDMPTVDGNGTNIAHGNFHLYSKVQGWNSDMSLYRLGYRLYDAKTQAELSVTSILSNHSDLYNVNGSLNEIKWSTKYPNVFYGVVKTWDNKGQFWKGTIDRDASPVAITNEVIHTFGAANTFTAFTLGKYEGNIDYNEEFVVFAARKIGGFFITVIVYDMINDTFIEKDFDGNNGNALINWTDSPTPQEFDWVSVSALGNHIIVSTNDGLFQYDMNLNFIGQLTDHATHGDMGIAQNGEEVFVQFKFSVPQGISAFRLQKFADGEPINVYRHRLLPEKYNGGHISCRNYQRPGWCYLSTVAEGYREVFALRINFGDHSLHVVNRFAQTHTRSYNAAGNSMSSLGGTSPDGKKVMFLSDWEVDPLDYYDRDTFLVE